MSGNLELCVWVFGELCYLEDLFKEWTYFIDLCHFFLETIHIFLLLFYIQQDTPKHRNFNNGFWSPQTLATLH